MTKYILVFGVLFPFLASATVSINDPQQLLAQLQAKFQTTDFLSLFRVAETASFDRYVESCEISCSESGPNTLGGCSNSCKEIPMTIHRSVLKMNEAGKAVIYGEEDGFYEEISPEDMLSCHGSLAERFISNLDSYLNLSGTVTLEKLSTFELPLAQNTSHERKVKAYSIWGKFLMTGSKQDFDFKVS
ncbi:MAG: hypothetical protein ACXWRA_17255, partial [Pseudobdellovibrionaceae bacterium]